MSIRRKSIGENLFDTFNTLIMIVAILAALYPFIFILFASVSDPLLIAKKGIKLLAYPVGFNDNAYRAILANKMMFIGYRNTILYVVLGTGINLLLTSFGAYALSRKHLRGAKAITILIVFTMYFHGGMIPNFLVVKGLNMIDTIWAMMIPGAISAYNLIVMRTGFAAIPDEIEESAKMDGANDFLILFRIMLPLAGPVIAVMILWYGIGHWNSFFSALLYLRKRDLYPLMLVLRDILMGGETGGTSGAGTDTVALSENIKYAAIVVATLPILLIYPFLQKYFVKGVMIGAVKG